MKKTRFKFIVTIFVLLSMTLPLLLVGCGEENGLFEKDPETVETDKFKVYEKSYSLNEINLIESSSFKALNSIDYTDLKKGEVSEEYISAIRSFAGRIYSEYAKKGFDDNFSFSPLGLYEVLCLAAVSSNDPTALQALDSVLGMDKERRKADFVNVCKSDIFSNSRGTMQLYNAAFLTNKYTANQDYIDDLTDYLIEAYSMNFGSQNDIKELLKWANQKMNEENFLTEKDLEIDLNTVMFLISTLYFDNRWANAFNTADSYTGKFYGESEKDVTFMHHTYFGDVYDYGDYVACYDYYCNNLKVKYFVAKDKAADIFELTKDVDLFNDDEEAKLSDDGYETVVNLDVPKFDNEYALNFNEVLMGIGLGCLYDFNGHVFDYAFTDMPEGVGTYLKYVKQKNKIAFGEDGTTIKSVTYASVSDNAAVGPHNMNTIDIKLDSPFIYVIYDSNDMPVYVGNLTNPA